MSNKTTHTAYAEYKNGAEIEITYTLTEGRAARWYLRNGDPGYPADPNEIEFVSARYWKGRACNPAEEAWAAEWLEQNEGEAMAAALEEKNDQQEAEFAR